MPRKAALSAWIGSALEYYDFLLFATAASLVFPELFFPEHDPAVATVASLLTFAMAYVVRPLGALLLGSLADTRGRKQVLVLTLFGMGCSTFLIGALPTYWQVGRAAPVLLVALRVIQGLSASGEQASAGAATLEHAREDRRAFLSSWTMSGGQFGVLLGTLIFIPISLLPRHSLLSWGWRIPFLLGVLVTFAGWWIRRDLPESPAFRQQQERRHPGDAPLRTLFRSYSPELLKVLLATLITVPGSVFQIYSLSYAVNVVGLSRVTMLSMMSLATIVALLMLPLWALAADRVGRKPIYLVSGAASIVFVWPYLWAVSHAIMLLVYLCGVLWMGVFGSAYFGSALALWSEQFDTGVRASGIAVATQFGLVLFGFAPSIAGKLAGPRLHDWVPVALFATATALVASISVITMRETHAVRLDELGTRG